MMKKRDSPRRSLPLANNSVATTTKTTTLLTMFSLSLLFLLSSEPNSILVAAQTAEPLPQCLRRFDETTGQDFSVETTSPCLFENGTDFDFPEENYRICYRTCIRTFTNGTEKCELRVPSSSGFQLQKIQFQVLEGDGMDGMSKTTVLASPNFLRSRPYRHSAVCRYNVKCAPGQMLRFAFNEHDIESPTEVFSNPLCLDQLKVNRSQYGFVKTTCGGITFLKEDLSDFNHDELLVEFQSNRVRRERGFSVSIQCLSPELYDTEGSESISDLDFNDRKRRSTDDSALDSHKPATRAIEQDDTLEEEEKDEMGREMREIFQNQGSRITLKRISSILERSTSNEGAALPRNRQRRYFRANWRIIKIGVSFIYFDRSIIFFKNGEQVYRLDGYQVFQVYNRAQGHDTFYDNAEGRIFRGYGKLMLGYGIAQYLEEGVDPVFRLSPTENEANQLLSNELIRLGFFDSEDTKVDDIDDPRLKPFQRPYPPRGNFTALALQASNSNNGALRATACLYRQLVLYNPCVLLRGNPYRGKKSKTD